MSDAPASATVATCRTCKGWTLVIVNDPDDTKDDLRDNARSVSDAVKRGRDIHTMTVVAFQSLSPCSCPRQATKGRKP